MSNKQEKAIKQYNKGLEASAKGNISLAVKFYREAIKLDPNFYQALNNLGNIYQKQKNNDAALDCFKKAIKVIGENAIVLNNIGNTYREKKDFEASIKYFERSITADPKYISPRLNLIAVKIDVQDWNSVSTLVASAKTFGVNSSLLDLVVLQSKYVDIDSSIYLGAVNRITLTLYKLDKEKSVATVKSFLDSLEVPNSNDCLINILLDISLEKNLNFLKDTLASRMDKTQGCKLKHEIYSLKLRLKSQENLASLIVDLKKYRKTYPQEAIFISLLCDAYFWNGDIDTAKSLSLELGEHNRVRPECSSWFEFMDHNFKEGWLHYFSGIQKSSLVETETHLDLDQTQDQFILIHADQGIGDQLMFLSCIDDLLKTHPKKVLLKCDHRLHPALKRSFPSIDLIDGNSPQNIDQSTGLSSLPANFRLSIESFYSKSPYFNADGKLKSKLKNQIDSLPSGLKIGFAWKGGTANHQRLADSKSMHLEYLKPLFKVPNTQWINLQYGDVGDTLNDLSVEYKNIHYFDEINPLIEIESQLALISNLDLVIQPSNASIHFAGALGVKSWVLLGHPHDFRWFPNGKDEQTAWYPSVRMIKKGQKQSWEELVESLVPELTALATTKS